MGAFILLGVTMEMPSSPSLQTKMPVSQCGKMAAKYLMRASNCTSAAVSKCRKKLAASRKKMMKIPMYLIKDHLLEDRYLSEDLWKIGMSTTVGATMPTHQAEEVGHRMQDPGPLGDDLGPQDGSPGLLERGPGLQ